MNRKLLSVLLFGLTAVALISSETQAGYDPTIGRWLSRDPMNNAELRQGPNLSRTSATIRSILLIHLVLRV